MKRAALLLAAFALVVIEGLIVMEPAQAANGVSVRTIPAKTVASGGTVVVKPVVTVRGRVSVRSKTLDVKRGSTYIRRGVTYARLHAGYYTVWTKVKYRLRSHGRWGRLRITVKTQHLRVSTRVPAPAPTPPPTVDDAAKPAPPCGSQTYRKSDGTPWVCTFADEFSGSELDRSKWSPQRTEVAGTHVGPECLVDDPDNIAVSDGRLRLVARKEAAPFTCRSPYGDYSTSYTSGGVTTWGNFSQAYGRFEFRVKFPATKVAGLQSSIWLYPVAHKYGGWPASGEIDIAEAYTSHPDRAIPYVHYNTANVNDTSVTDWYCKLDMTTFHTYVGEWTPTSIKISYDGQVCMSMRGIRPHRWWVRSRSTSRTR